MKNNTPGFTLIEVIVSTGIVLLIGSGIIALEREVIMNTRIIQSSLISQQQVRKTLNTFSNEVRKAVQIAPTGAPAIESATTTSFIFYSDIDNDGVAERVRYFLSTSMLKKGVIKYSGGVYPGASEILTTVVNDVKNPTSTPIFLYYDNNYNGVSSSTPIANTTDPHTIRLVKMTLSVDPNAARSPVFQSYTTQVMLRNLKDNY